MALSGTIYKYSGDITLKVIWSATQSIENNSSTITVETHIVHKTGRIKTKYAGSGNLMYRKNWSIPEYTSDTYSDTNYHDELLNTNTVTLAHNADGTLSGNLIVSIPDVSYWLPGASEATTGTLTASGAIVLDQISRATQPTVSVSSVNMGDVLTINMPRATSGLKHMLTYQFGAVAGSIGADLDTTYDWTVPIGLASQIPSATAGTLTIYCETFSGSTSLGKKPVTVKATVPASVVPTISNIAVSDATGNYDIFNTYVRSKSKANINVTAAGAYGSTIKAYKIVANGVTYTANNCTTNELATAGANTITVTVTDTRGRTATDTATVNVADYYAPKITSFSAIRCNADGVADENGAYMLIKGFVEISGVNGRNTINMKIRYRVQGTTTWTDISTNTSSYAWGINVILAISTDNIYEVQVVATDRFTTADKTIVVPTVYTLMDFRENGKGMAFGKVATQDGLDVNMPAQFRDNVHISSTELSPIVIERENSDSHVAMGFKNTEDVLGYIGMSDKNDNLIMYSSSGIPMYVFVHSGNFANKVVNSLTSTEAGLALSANQGKVLNEKISTLEGYHYFHGTNGQIGTVNLSIERYTSYILTLKHDGAGNYAIYLIINDYGNNMTIHPIIENANWTVTKGNLSVNITNNNMTRYSDYRLVVL